MGTNYYAVKKLPNSIKGKICDLIENDLYEEANELFNTNYEKIHIGKQSCGWKFLFNYNHFKYYDLTKESINNFLRNDEIIFFDEYGKVINVDNFWEMVENNKNKLDNMEYYSKSESLPFMLFEESIPYDLKDKYDVEGYEFYSDGLRFSSSTNFS